MKLLNLILLIAVMAVQTFIAHAQTDDIRGRIVDADTGEPLAFVHILINDSRRGTTSSIDGTFRLVADEKIERITFSYVGYEKLTLNVSEYLNQNRRLSREQFYVRMKEATMQLREVVFHSGENPAHPIIRKVVENRKINNPENIKSFTYKSYNKFIIDAEIDEEDIEEDDDFMDFLETKYLFLMESVTERKYLKPNRSKEIVLANRVSGLKNPMFTTLANSFQPFSFYEDYIKVGRKNYLNPISRNSTKKYFFTLEDSIYSGEHKVYIIGFEPRNANFDGLKGVLYINTYKYAVENVIAETANLLKHIASNVRVTTSEESEGNIMNEAGKGINEGLDEISEDLEQEADRDGGMPSLIFRVQQKYTLIDEEYWFPLQLNTDIEIGDASGQSESLLKGVGRSYLQEIELFDEVRPREFDRLAVEYAPDANRKDETFWNQYRTEPLTLRGKQTYEFLDSVGQAENVDRYMTALSVLTTGKVPIGKFELDVDRILDYNRYESVRLGVGAHTSKLFSQWLKFGGYTAYGFGDKRFKYGGDIRVFLTNRNELTLRGAYYNDVIESGSTRFYLDNDPMSSERHRRFLVSNMDRIKGGEAGVSFYFLKYLDAYLSLRDYTRETTTSYGFAGPQDPPGSPSTRFHFTEFSAQLKYSFREKYVEVLGNKVSLGTEYPVFWVNYTRGFDNLGQGEFDYHKVDFKMHKSFLIRGFGSPSFTIKAGYVLGDVPYSNLYNGNGSYSLQVPLEAVNSFQTMRMNEFLSDRYLAIYYTHRLGKITLHRTKSLPEFYLVANAGIGSLENPEQHVNYTFRTMEKGYYESGLSIRNLYNVARVFGLGFGTYYRFGPYSLGKTIDNFSFKLTTQWTLKL